MPEVIPPNLVDLLYHLLVPLPRNIWHAVSITDAFQPTLQMATGLNEFQYKTILVASGIFQRRAANIVISKRHLDNLRQQLQENVQLYYELTSLERGGNKLYFLSLGLARHPNPRLQIQENNRRILRPRGINLTPQQRNQIHLLFNERLPPPPPEPEPPLIHENDNELEEEIEIVQQHEQNADEINDQQQQLHPYQRFLYYQNQLTHFEEAFQQWANEQYERERRNFEKQQEQ